MKTAAKMKTKQNKGNLKFDYRPKNKDNPKTEDNYENKENTSNEIYS